MLVSSKMVPNSGSFGLRLQRCLALVMRVSTRPNTPLWAGSSISGHLMQNTADLRYGLLRRYVINLVLSPKYSFNSVACFVLAAGSKFRISLFACFGGTVANTVHLEGPEAYALVATQPILHVLVALLPRKQQGQALEPGLFAVLAAQYYS